MSLSYLNSLGTLICSQIYRVCGWYYVTMWYVIVHCYGTCICYTYFMFTLGNI